MNIRGLFVRRNSAAEARNRLQILLAHEREGEGGGPSDLIITLREEILAVIARHVPMDPSKVNVSMKREDGASIIEIDLEVPDPVVPRLRVVGR